MLFASSVSAQSVRSLSEIAQCLVGFGEHPSSPVVRSVLRKVDRLLRKMPAPERAAVWAGFEKLQAVAAVDAVPQNFC